VIRTFRHKGVKRFFEKSDVRGVGAERADRLRRILDRLDAAAKPDDMNIPGLQFHGLSGKRKGTYAVSISGNWRLTFQMVGGEVLDVDMEDYH
jgi:proteic killer suppression protein